jgi:hypothetical protein
MVEMVRANLRFSGRLRNGPSAATGLLGVVSVLTAPG